MEVNFEDAIIHENETILDVDDDVTKITGYYRAELMGKSSLELGTQTSQKILENHVFCRCGKAYDQKRWFYRNSRNAR